MARGLARIATTTAVACLRRWPVVRMGTGGAMKGASFKVYQDDQGQWRWRLQSVNGRILADSGEGYTRHADALRAVRMVKKAIRNA